MLFHRRRDRFKLTEKTHSKIGIVTMSVSLILLMVYLVLLRMAFLREEGLSLYFGSMGVIALILSICCVGFSIKSLREENSFMLFPRLAIFFSILAFLSWGGTYALGIVQ